jgi:hypothetical protein
MAANTLRAFVDALEAISVTGVTRRYTSGPPPSIEDLPAQFVRLPQSSDEPFYFGAQGGWPVLRADLIICYEAVAQSTGASNFDGVIDMIDNLNTALRATSTTGALVGLSWSARQSIEPVAEIDYWAVICEIQGGTHTS